MKRIDGVDYFFFSGVVGTVFSLSLVCDYPTFSEFSIKLTT